MSTEADIVERLRKHVNDRGGASIDSGAWQMMLSAAAEIELLRAVLKRIADGYGPEITKLRAERDAAARDMRERCAKVADEYAAPNRFSCSDVWKDDMKPSDVYDTAAVDVGGWIANDIRTLPDSAAPAAPAIATSGKDAT